MPQWLQRTSPFEWLPAMPAEAFRIAPFAGLTIVVGALVVIGFANFERRDLG
jgi:ABC-2 type transport system permease protein